MAILKANMLLIILMQYVSANENNIMNNFRVISRVRPDDNALQYLIASFKFTSKFNCLKQCNQDQTCLSCSFSTNTLTNNNCFLYNYDVNANGTNSQLADIYKKCALGDFVATLGVHKCLEKKPNILKFVYNSIKMHYLSQFGTKTFNETYDITYSSTANLYYVSDYSHNRVIAYNLDWVYQYDVTIGTPFGVKSVDSDVYVASGSAITRYSTFIATSTVVQNTRSGSYYNLMYDSNTNRIVTIEWNTYEVKYLNRDLTVYNSISLSVQPRSINIYGNILYVGTTNSSILMIANGLITTYSNICQLSNWVTSIEIDLYGNMLICCFNDTAIYAYYGNMTYTGHYLSIHRNIVYNAKFDSKGRLILLGGSPNGIEIFY